VPALLLPAASLTAQESLSAPVAKELSALLSQQKLDAIAAKDPDTPDRFVAALYFPDVQLLVMSGRYPVPVLLQQQLDRKNYSEIYADLSGASIQDSQLFFQDLKADGLHAGKSDAPDILYERVVAQTVFDGDWDKHNMTEKAYMEKFAEADKQYSRLLMLLVAEAKKTR
jgi:hypothetical protein